MMLVQGFLGKANNGRTRQGETIMRRVRSERPRNSPPVGNGTATARALLLAVVTVFSWFSWPCRVPAAEPKLLFTPEEVAAYVPKGPSACFRHICLEYNTPTRSKKVFTPEELNRFFCRYDAVEYAEFSKEINLDAALILAVPQGGYTTYLQTKVGEPYPWLKEQGRDFFGEVTRELHKQGIASLGYIIIGWNLKYAHEHPEVSFGWYPLICLNSPYTELICGYSREVLTHYPIDGLRYDILDQPVQCRCEGCKALYKELFGDQMPDEWKDWQTRERFRIESITRSVKRIYETCKKTKPSVEIWQNWFDDRMACDLRASKYVDLAYLEFADPFRELFLNGVFDKGCIITGKILESHAARRMCLVLGGRCYSYFPVSGETALPDDTGWFTEDLAPFYAMVAEIEPYLVGAKPVAGFGIVFSEATRFRLPGYNRKPYVAQLRRVAEPCLAQSNPPEFIAAAHLAQRDLSRLKLLVLPESSGLPSEALAALVDYARGGGQLLVTGAALLYDEAGRPRQGFAIGDALGVQLAQSPGSAARPDFGQRWRWSNHMYGGRRVALKIDAPGKRVLSVWMRESGSRIDRLVLTGDRDYVPTGAGPAPDTEESAAPWDLIAFEAESFSENIPRNQCSWQPRSDLDGFSGKGFVQAMPTTGKKLIEDYESTAPEMRYPISFEAPGVYYVWVRQSCDSTSQDSIHVGLDGEGLMTYDFNTTAERPQAARDAGQHRRLPELDLAVGQEWLRQWIRGPILEVQATAGRTVISTTNARGERLPLLHLRELDKGRILYLANSGDADLVRHVIDAMTGSRPVTVTPRDKQAILTWQETQRRWILHLIDDGEYTIEIHRDFAAPTGVTGKYPDDGWSYELSKTSTGLRIVVHGDARNRLLVFE